MATLSAVWEAAVGADTSISSSTLTRWLVSALAALVMAGGAFWMNTISNQIPRIEENTGKQIGKIEVALEAMRANEAALGDKNAAKLVDVQIELKMHQLRLERLDQEVTEMQRQGTAGSAEKIQRLEREVDLLKARRPEPEK